MGDMGTIYRALCKQCSIRSQVCKPWNTASICATKDALPGSLVGIVCVGEEGGRRGSGCHIHRSVISGWDILKLDMACFDKPEIHPDFPSGRYVFWNYWHYWQKIIKKKEKKIVPSNLSQKGKQQVDYEIH